MKLILIGFIGAVCVIYVSSLNWRRSVKIALVLVVIEGALRKWALPQASQLIYFLKDFVLVGAYFSYFFYFPQKQKNIIQTRSIQILIGLIAIWCLFQAFNPSVGSPIIGFFGLRNYLIYIPLMWVVPSLFQSEKELYRYLRSYLLLLIPVGLLAIAQYFSPPSSPLNVYAQDMEQQIAVSGDAVRVTGTFSYLGGYTTYLQVCLCFLIPLINSKQTRLWQWLTMAELSVIAITTFMTGSRGIMIFMVLLLGSFFLIEGIRNFSSVVSFLQKFFLPAVISFVLVVTKFNTAIDSFNVRASNSKDILPRIIDSFTEPFQFMLYKQFDGFGTGATFQANGAIRTLFGLPSGEQIPVGHESEMGRIALELGPIGFLLWYGLKILLIIALWKVYTQLQRPFLRQLALCAFLIQLISLPSQLVFNHTANCYHWFINGFILLLPLVERMEICKENYYFRKSHEQSSHLADSSY